MVRVVITESKPSFCIGKIMGLETYRQSRNFDERLMTWKRKQKSVLTAPTAIKIYHMYSGGKVTTRVSPFLSLFGCMCMCVCVHLCFFVSLNTSHQSRFKRQHVAQFIAFLCFFLRSRTDREFSHVAHSFYVWHRALCKSLWR